MWIILFNAVDEFGMNTSGANVSQAQIDSAKRKVADEAMYGALRIAGLVRHQPLAFDQLLNIIDKKANVLTTNGYLVSEIQGCEYGSHSSSLIRNWILL